MCIWEGSMQLLESAPVSEKDIEGALAHAGATLENQNAVLLGEALKRDICGPIGFQEYLWFNMPDGEAYCTACRQEMPRPKEARHKEYTHCPACGRIVQARSEKISHSNLRQEFYAVQWQKSVLEKDVLVMIGFFCDADYRRNAKAEKQIIPVLIDIFRYGKSAVRYQRCAYGYEGTGKCTWYKRRNVAAIGSAYFGMKKPEIIFSERRFMRALEGTPFKGAYETIIESERQQGIIRRGDMSELISHIARKPWIEYMIKAGFPKVAESAIGTIEGGLLAYRKKTVREIMKLSTDRYAELKGKRADITSGTLWVIQKCDAQGVRIKLAEAERLSKKIPHHRRDRLMDGVTREAVRYMLREENDLIELLDYWEMARNAEMDLRDPEVKYPRRLTEAHDRLADALEAERERNRYAIYAPRAEKNQRKLDERMQALERKYCFSANGLVLRPARTLMELINESNALSHCVASYIEGYAEGRTDICFLRRAEEPDRPWRTIEISPRTGEVIQDRGKRNDRDRAGRSTMTEDLRFALDAFWEAFKAHANERKEKKTA